MSADPERFFANAKALSHQQPGLGRGLLELSEKDVRALADVALPNVESSMLETFGERASEKVDGDCLVLLGMSSPEMLLEIRKYLQPHQSLIVIEPTLDLALRLLANADYRPVFDHPFNGLVIAAEDADLRRQLESLVSRWGLQHLQLITNPMRPLGGAMRELIAELLQHAIDAVEISAAFSAQYGILTVDNIAANLLRASGGMTLGDLSERCQGLPAFIIGAGPSLDDVADSLKDMRARGVVIACDAALPCLLEVGVDPDFVVTLDVVDAKAKVFDIAEDSEAQLVALLSTHPELLRRFNGATCIVPDGHALARWASSELAEDWGLPSLGNVAHLGYALAAQLGCSSVVLAGVDFSFSRGGRTYASGVIHQPAEVLDGTSTQFDNTTVQVTANDGKAVTTMRNMPMYANTLAQMIASAKIPTVTIANEAMRIAGVRLRELPDVLHDMPALGKRLHRPLHLQPSDNESVQQARKRLKRELGLLAGELRSYAADALAFVDSADAENQRINSGDVDGDEALSRITRALGQFGRHRGVNELIEPLQPAVSYEIARLQRETYSMPEAAERARRRILALAGPAKHGADLAEHIADRLYDVRKDLTQVLDGSGEEE